LGGTYAIQTHVDFERELMDFSERVGHPVCKVDVKTIFINELGLYAIFPIPKVANLISLISLGMPYTIGFF
jgi:hypothetical protein